MNVIFTGFILCLYFLVYTVHLSLANPVFNQLILVEKGNQNACVFEHATELMKGEVVPLTLLSHPGKAIAKQYEKERHFGEWRYIESRGDVVENAISVKYEEFTFLKLDHEDLVFDVAFWNMKVGTPVNFVGGTNHDKTYSYGGGRDFVINDDGTISCKHFPNLVLGFNTENVVNDYFIGPYSTNYNDAKSYCESNGGQLAQIYNADDQKKAETACGSHTCWIGFVEQGGDVHTSKMQQVWGWENGYEASYINWAHGEPNNFMDVDEKNAVLNCCVERCTTCDGTWFDAPKSYNRPRPLCFKPNHVLTFSSNDEKDEDGFLWNNMELLVRLMSFIVASVVVSFFVLPHCKNGSLRTAMYESVSAVVTYDVEAEGEAETEMVTNPAVAYPSAPAKLI